MVALVTPMLPDDSVDFIALEKLIEIHVQAKTSAIIAMGTTGESATLNYQEHCEVVSFIVDKSAGRIPVIAGTGANSTTEAIELTQHAKDTGVDACLLVTPYYNKPTQQGLFLHYQKIAQSVDIPQILYNVPGRTACDLLPETVGRLAKIKNIIGIKEATGDLTRVAEIKQLVNDDFDLYTGDDETGIDFILLGGHGAISVSANILPAQMVKSYQLALNGNAIEAKRLDNENAILHKNLFIESNPIPVKWCMAEMGLIGATIRLPMTVLDEKHHKLLRKTLITVGAI